jgi:hypothetical protein
MDTTNNADTFHMDGTIIMVITHGTITINMVVMVQMHITMIGMHRVDTPEEAMVDAAMVDAVMNIKGIAGAAIVMMYGFVMMEDVAAVAMVAAVAAVAVQVAIVDQLIDVQTNAGVTATIMVMVTVMGMEVATTVVAKMLNVIITVMVINAKIPLK